MSESKNASIMLTSNVCFFHISYMDDNDKYSLKYAS